MLNLFGLIIATMLTLFSVAAWTVGRERGFPAYLVSLTLAWGAAYCFVTVFEHW